MHHNFVDIHGAVVILNGTTLLFALSNAQYNSIFFIHCIESYLSYFHMKYLVFLCFCRPYFELKAKFHQRMEVGTLVNYYLF